MNRTLITSALPYANGYIHLGHCAGAYLPADMYARFLRLSGEDIIYVCGSDEHGVAINISAEKENSTPKDIIDKYHSANHSAFQKFGMSFDIYSRTSHDIHHDTAKEFFADLLAKGYLLEKEEEQFYDNKAGMFLPDRYVEGECPNCSYDKARGDQCDKCGAYYNQIELKNPKSIVSGDTPIVKKTTHWYMQFNKFQEFLENYIESHSKEWKDNVVQQSRSWLKQGLTERAITRDLSWGVKIDKIPGIDKDKAKGKVLYVWFDAVLGYISMTKELMNELATNGLAKKEDWKKWWQDENTRYIAFIGKDNIVFHTLIFPAMLHAKGGYLLPDNVPANEFLNLEGQKFSKSRNWSIDLKDFLKDFPESHYIDALRYALAMSFPETKDADFTWKDFQARNNNELAAIFGNFVNRAMQFMFKNFNGKVPTLSEAYKFLPGDWNNLIDYFESTEIKDYEELFASVTEKLKRNMNENDFLLICSLWKGVKESSSAFRKFRFRDAVTEIMNVARAANKYFNDEAPWKSINENPEQCAKSLFVCVQLVHSLSILFAPITPFASKRIQMLFDMPVLTGAVDYKNKEANNWNFAAYPTIEEATKVMQPSIIFNKVEDDVIKAQIEKLGSFEEESAKPKEEYISYEDVMKVKLRTAKVIHAEKVAKSKKLLKLQLDLGKEKRQIIAGVAEHYAPEELIGKTIVVVANLQPAKLRGEESQGMMLAASTDDGKLCFVTPEKQDFPAGAEVR